jgi:hypothetical protein
VTPGGPRRVVLVAVGYLTTAVVVFRAADWVRPVLALPAAFTRLLGVGLAAGLPLALLLAWHYPKLGHHGMHADRVDPPEGGGER